VKEPRQQVFPKGLRKIVNFRGGSTKNSKFLRGSSGKPFPKGSKISNLVNRGGWILNGMALIQSRYANIAMVINYQHSQFLNK
jgi:hypothetical protein